MKLRLAEFLVRLYPPLWRARYGAEFLALLQSGPGGLRTAANVIWSALGERILPTAAPALKQSASAHHFQWWCTRAPWAIFSLGPVFLLAATYVVALFLLWSGWNYFLPGADTPFGHPVPGPTYGLGNIYFQADKFFYFAAPVFLGWALSLVAARQKVKAVWPSLGLVLMAVLAATNQVHASRTAVPRGLGNVSIEFNLGMLSSNLQYALSVLTIAALPYLVWRLRQARSLLA